MGLSLWFSISTRIDFRNGMFQKLLYESASSTTIGRLMTSLRFPNALAKKSPTGASTPGRLSPS
jgi:hypothetical protein